MGSTIGSDWAIWSAQTTPNNSQRFYGANVINKNRFHPWTNFTSSLQLRSTVLICCLVVFIVLQLNIYSGIVFADEAVSSGFPQAQASQPVSTNTKAVHDARRLYDHAAVVAHWVKIKNSSNPSDYREFLSKYGESPYAAYARFRLARLEPETKSSLPIHDGSNLAEENGSIGKQADIKLGKSDIFVPSKKYALVISNGDYPNGKDLPPAYKNAADIQEALEYLEFKVSKHTDLNLENMQLVLAEFTQQMQNVSDGAVPGSVAVVFYFFGLDFQAGDINYLVPAGVDPSSPDAAANSFKLMDGIIKKLPNRYPGITIALIDTARADIMDRKGVDDFSPIAAPEGTIVFFGTRSGRTALAPIDAKVNTFFTDALVEVFQKANGVTPIDDLFMIVAGRTLDRATRIFDKLGIKLLPQYPESISNLRGKFIIRNKQLELELELERERRIQK